MNTSNTPQSSTSSATENNIYLNDLAPLIANKSEHEETPSANKYMTSLCSQREIPVVQVGMKEIDNINYRSGFILSINTVLGTMHREFIYNICSQKSNFGEERTLEETRSRYIIHYFHFQGTLEKISYTLHASMVVNTSCTSSLTFGWVICERYKLERDWISGI